VQEALNSQGFANSRDSLFGPFTEALVKRFQQSRQIKHDGVVRPNDALAAGNVKTRLSWLLFAAALLACRGEGWAQTSEPALRLRVAAKSFQAPGTESIGLHWVPDPYPGPDDVRINNSTLAQKLKDALAELKTDAICGAGWVLDSPGCRLTFRIEQMLREYRFLFVPDNRIEIPPANTSARLDLTLRAEYVVPLVSPIESVTASVATKNASAGSPIIRMLSVAEVLMQLGPTADASGVPLNQHIQIHFSDLDRRRPAGNSDFPIDALEAELFTVGLNALKIAAGRGLALGKSVPNTRILTTIDDLIAQVYVVERPPWPVTIRTLHKDGKYTIEMKDLQFVTQVRAEVQRGTIPGEDGPTGFVGNTDAGERKIVDILTKASSDIHAFVESRGTGLEGKIPSRASMLAAIETLRTFPKVEAPYDMRSEGGSVILQATYDWIEASIEAKLDLQVEYDVEQLFTGGGSIRESNLIGTLLQRDLRETWEFDADAGTETQRATLNLTISRERGTWSRFTFGSNFLALASRDRNQRMGNLPAVLGQPDKDSQLIFQEVGWQPKVFLQHDVGTVWKNRLRVEHYLDWRRVLVRPQLRTLPAAVDGHLNAWVLAVEEMIGHDFTPAGEKDPVGGLSEVNLSFKGEARRATRALGGDFPFRRRQFSVSGETIFGWSTRHQLLARHRFGDGSTTAGTPLFQLFRLGGPGNIRGIEEGEMVGRRLRFHQSTVGIGLPVFFPALNEAEGQLAALANTFVEVFYDTANIERVAGRRSASGYGVAAEIRRLPAGKHSANITIGWAKSRQSVLHGRGMMTLGVDFNLN
jgi:peptidoglycan hydrolase-like protein with peptidoglycan-binding domain